MKNKNSILETKVPIINKNKLKKEISESIKQIICTNMKKLQKKIYQQYRKTTFNFTIPSEKFENINNTNIQNNTEKNIKFFKTDKLSKHYKVMTSETKKKI